MTRDPDTGQFRRDRGNRGNAAPSRASQQSRPWASSRDRGGSSSGGFATALGAISAAGIGAAVMYLMDPNQGSERRHHLAEVTGSALGTIGHKAADAGSALYEQIPSGRDLADTGRLLGQRTADAAGSARDTAGGWLESAREMLPSYRQMVPASLRGSSRHSGHSISATTAGISGLAALAIGVGAMWLLDPQRGRGRRAWLGQKTTRCLNETGSFMRATGRHLANKSRGYYHESRKAVGGAGRRLTDSSVAESIRSTLGRLGLRSSSSVGVECIGGCVTLTGRCVADDVDTVVRTTRETYGVNNVINNMEISDRFDSPMSSTPTGI